MKTKLSDLQIGDIITVINPINQEDPCDIGDYPQKITWISGDWIETIVTGGAVGDCGYTISGLEAGRYGEVIVHKDRLKEQLDELGKL